MTVENTLTKKKYEGNGLAKEFAVPFAVQSPDHIKMFFIDAQGKESPVTSNFSITRDAKGDPQSVVYPVSGPAILFGQKLLIYRDTPRKQVVDITNAGAYHPEVIERQGLDGIVMMLQEMQEELNRKIGSPITSDFDADAFLKEFFDIAQKAIDASKSAQDALVECQELLAIIPVPTDKDAGKVIAVRVIDGEAVYQLVTQSGGSGGGTAEYTIPAKTADGKIVVSLAALGHPEMPGMFNPIVNIICVTPHYFCITNRSAKEFTVQVYDASGKPGVEINEYIECGTFESGTEIQCGSEGTGSNVELAVSIPLPPA